MNNELDNNNNNDAAITNTLSAEAQQISVGGAPVDEIVQRGRTLKRRRAGIIGVGAAATLVAAGAVAVNIPRSDGQLEMSSSSSSQPSSTDVAVSDPSATSSPATSEPPQFVDPGDNGGDAVYVADAYGDGFLVASSVVGGFPDGEKPESTTVSFFTTNDGTTRTPVGEPLVVPGAEPQLHVDGDQVLVLSQRDWTLFVSRSTDLVEWTVVEVPIEGVDSSPSWSPEVNALFDYEIMVSDFTAVGDHFAVAGMPNLVASDELAERLVPDRDDSEPAEAYVYPTPEGVIVQELTVDEVSETTAAYDESSYDESAYVEPEPIPYSDLGLSDADVDVVLKVIEDWGRSLIITGPVTGGPASPVATQSGVSPAWPTPVASYDGQLVLAFYRYDPSLSEGSASVDTAVDGTVPEGMEGIMFEESPTLEIWSSPDAADWTKSSVSLPSDSSWGYDLNVGPTSLYALSSDKEPGTATQVFSVGLDGSTTELGDVPCPDGFFASGSPFSGDGVLIVACDPDELGAEQFGEPFVFSTSEYKITSVEEPNGTNGSTTSYVVEELESGEIVAEGSVDYPSQAYDELLEGVERDGEHVIILHDDSGRDDVVIPYAEIVAAEQQAQAEAEAEMSSVAGVLVASVDGINWSELDLDYNAMEGPDQFAIASNGNNILVEEYTAEGSSFSVKTVG